MRLLPLTEPPTIIARTTRSVVRVEAEKLLMFAHRSLLWLRLRSSYVNEAHFISCVTWVYRYCPALNTYYLYDMYRLNVYEAFYIECRMLEDE